MYVHIWCWNIWRMISKLTMSKLALYLNRNFTWNMDLYTLSVFLAQVACLWRVVFHTVLVLTNCYFHSIFLVWQSVIFTVLNGSLKYIFKLVLNYHNEPVQHIISKLFLILYELCGLCCKFCTMKTCFESDTIQLV